MFDPEILEFPDLHLLGLRVAGKPKDLGKLVPKGWQELRSRLGAVAGVKDPTKQIGFLLPRDHVLALGRIATYIGVEVAPDTPEPKGLKRHFLPASRYAAFRYRGSFLAPEFAGFYPGIFKALAEKGLEFDGDRGWIEMYDDATHDWEDKTDPSNLLTVAFPLKR
jgi:predicted transcriptional regulator YdeE